MGNAGCMGELKCGRKSVLNFLYLMIFAKPFCSLVCASNRREVLASVDLADVLGPCIKAASVFFVDYYGPQFTV